LYLITFISVCGWKYFPNSRGVISGLTIAGYGFGSFIFNFVCQSIANPSNKHPDVPVKENGVTVKYFGPDVYDEVPKML
jgi:MFS transporter, OFA family, oxalate/formate antiporter